jgi:hypothetical protein
VHKFHAVLDGGFGNVDVFQFCLRGVVGLGWVDLNRTRDVEV